MCSWCYGIALELKSLKEYYAKEGIQFEIVAGGLRPRGGDEWTEEFKGFLKHHWEEVAERSGQKFGFKLFERAPGVSVDEIKAATEGNLIIEGNIPEMSI